MPSGNIPGGGLMAAILRYPFAAGDRAFGAIPAARNRRAAARYFASSSKSANSLRNFSTFGRITYSQYCCPGFCSKYSW